MPANLPHFGTFLLMSRKTDEWSKKKAKIMFQKLFESRKFDDHSRSSNITKFTRDRDLLQMKFDEFIADEPKLQKECRNFANGSCKFGENCKFLHSGRKPAPSKKKKIKENTNSTPHISQSFVKASDAALAQEMGSLTLKVDQSSAAVIPVVKPKFKLVLKSKAPNADFSDMNTPQKVPLQDRIQSRPGSSRSTKTQSDDIVNVNTNGQIIGSSSIRDVRQTWENDREFSSAGGQNLQNRMDHSQSRNQPLHYKQNKQKGLQNQSQTTSSARANSINDSPRSRSLKLDRSTDNKSFSRQKPRKNGSRFTVNGNNNGSSVKKRNVYAPHWSRDAIKTALEDDAIFEGILRINKKNRQDGYVRREGGDENDIFIPGIKNQNRALEGDVVVVKLLVGEDLERGVFRLTQRKKLRPKRKRIGLNKTRKDRPKLISLRS